MSTTDHPDHTNHVGPQCPAPGLDPISVLRDAVAIIATLDHTSTAEATDHPHIGTHTALGAVHRRWAPPLHQRQHPPHQVPERVWTIALAAAAPTRPTPIPPPPPNPTGRTPGRTLKVAGQWR